MIVILRDASKFYILYYCITVLLYYCITSCYFISGVSTRIFTALPGNYWWIGICSFLLEAYLDNKMFYQAGGVDLYCLMDKKAASVSHLIKNHIQSLKYTV